MRLPEVLAFDIAPAVNYPATLSIKFSDDLISAVAVCFVVTDAIGQQGRDSLCLVLFTTTIEKYLDGGPDEYGANLKAICPH